MNRFALPALLATLPLALAGCDLLNLGKDDTEDTGRPADGDTDGDDSGNLDDVDADQDGFNVDEDCDDANADVNPNAQEICGDGIDNDCDNQQDEEGETRYYRDADGDGFGDREDEVLSCEEQNGYVTRAGDCDDRNEDIYPGADEVCDGEDNDCNGDIDDGAASSTWYRDADGDGYGDDDSAVSSCESPGAGYVTEGGDCDDTDAEITEPSEYPADDDGDGFGDPNSTTIACAPLAGNDLDCDDSNPLEPQVVSSSASGTEDGSLAHPWSSVQDGIDNARLCVAVLPGTYTETIDFGGNDVEVFATNGPSQTFLHGGGGGSVVTFQSGETAAAELRGFTITGGTGTLEETSSSSSCGSSSTCITEYKRFYGGGVFIDGASPTLKTLWIATNTLPDYSEETPDDTTTVYVYSYGGGIFATNARGVTIDRVHVGYNQADQGGGIYAGESSTLNITKTRVIYNQAASGAGIAAGGGTVNLTNGLLVGNLATGEGGGLFSEDGTVTFWNVTAAANAATNGGGIAAMGTSTFKLYSSIVYDTNSGQGVFVDSGATVDAEYSDVDGSAGNDWSANDPTGTDGNISSNPAFTNYTDNNTDDDDFSLTSSSPAKNTGNPSASYNDADGSRNDMGAYGGPGGSW